MSVKITELDEGKTLEVEVQGKLVESDYELFVPMTEQRIGRFGKVNLLVLMREFDGWSAAALWDDVKFDAKHFNDIDRLAVVGDQRWEEGMTKFCRPFTTAAIKFFEPSDLAEARRWVAGGAAAVGEGLDASRR